MAPVFNSIHRSGTRSQYQLLAPTSNFPAGRMVSRLIILLVPPSLYRELGNIDHPRILRANDGPNGRDCMERLILTHHTLEWISYPSVFTTHALWTSARRPESVSWSPLLYFRS